VIRLVVYLEVVRVREKKGKQVNLAVESSKFDGNRGSHFLDNPLIYGCQVARIRSNEKSSNLIGNLTRDILSRSIVPQLIMLPRAKIRRRKYCRH
jgi:hypothetical protein